MEVVPSDDLAFTVAANDMVSVSAECVKWFFLIYEHIILCILTVAQKKKNKTASGAKKYKLRTQHNTHLCI